MLRNVNLTWRNALVISAPVFTLTRDTDRGPISGVYYPIARALATVVSGDLSSAALSELVSIARVGSFFYRSLQTRSSYLIADLINISPQDSIADILATLGSVADVRAHVKRVPASDFYSGQFFETVDPNDPADSVVINSLSLGQSGSQALAYLVEFFENYPVKDVSLLARERLFVAGPNEPEFRRIQVPAIARSLLEVGADLWRTHLCAGGIHRLLMAKPKADVETEWGEGLEAASAYFERVMLQVDSLRVEPTVSSILRTANDVLDIRTHHLAMGAILTGTSEEELISILSTSISAIADGVSSSEAWAGVGPKLTGQDIIYVPAHSSFPPLAQAVSFEDHIPFDLDVPPEYTPISKGTHFTFPRGVTAVVGTTAAGKSTVLRALMRVNPNVTLVDWGEPGSKCGSDITVLERLTMENALIGNRVVIIDSLRLAIGKQGALMADGISRTVADILQAFSDLGHLTNTAFLVAFNFVSISGNRPHPSASDEEIDRLEAASQRVRAKSIGEWIAGSADALLSVSLVIERDAPSRLLFQSSARLPSARARRAPTQVHIRSAADVLELSTDLEVNDISSDEAAALSKPSFNTSKSFQMPVPRSRREPAKIEPTNISISPFSPTE